MCPYQNPTEHNRLPEEYIVTEEHIVPEEYPESRPGTKTVKKKNWAKYLMMFVFFGFAALHLCFGFLFGDIDLKKPELDFPGYTGQGATLPPVSPTLDLSFFKEGLSNASKKLQQANYIGAAVAVCDCLSDNFVQGNGYQLHDLNLVFRRDAISVFDGQDVTDGSGVYLRFVRKIVQVYNDKVDDYDPEERLIVTLIYVEKEGRDSRVMRILNVQIPTFYLSYGNSVQADSSYLEGVFSSEYDSEQAMRMDFSIHTAWSEPNVGDYNAYALRRVHGSVKRGRFSSEVAYKDIGLLLNEETTAFVPSGTDAAYENIYDLNEEGKLVLSKLDYVDLSGYDPASGAYDAARTQALADPQVRYILEPEQNGNSYLYVKNVVYEENETHRGRRHNITNLDGELFPLTDTLPQWLELEPHIQ